MSLRFKPDTGRLTGRRTLPALILGAAVALGACDEGALNEPFAPAPASTALVDGANGGGYSGFLFLAPLVGQPDKGTQEPLAGLTPHVEICKFDADACTADQITFEYDEIIYDVDHYKVEWDTKAEGQDPIDTDAQTYRIQVFLGARLLGYADIQFGGNGGEAKRLNDSDSGVIGLKDGRTVPINFFIGDALETELCGTGLDCRLATAYDGQDNLIVTKDGDAALYIPQSALPSGGPYTVLIRELESCAGVQFPADLPVGASLPSYPSCYEYLLDPDPVMQDFVTVAQCIDEDAVSAAGEDIEELQLGAWHDDLSNLPPGVPEYELLPNVAAPTTLSCDDYVPGPEPTGVAAVLREVRRGVTDFLLGKAAFAGHSGLGGAARDLSIVQWYDPGVRVAGFDTNRGGFISPLSAALAPAMQSLVDEYGYVWRTTAYTLDAELFDGDVDFAFLGTVQGNSDAIDALSQAEQDALADYVEHGGCALLMPDNDSFGGGNDAVNESLIDPFGLDITGTLGGQQTATVTAAGSTDPATAGIISYLQNYPGWFNNIGGGTVLASNSSGPAMVTIPGGGGPYQSSGPVFAFSDANQFFGGSFAGKFGNPANEQLFVQTVAACGTEPPPPAPIVN